MPIILCILCCMLQVQMKGSPIIQDGGTMSSPQQEEGGPRVSTTALKRRTGGWRRGKQRCWAFFPNCRTTHLVSPTATKVAQTLRTVSTIKDFWCLIVENTSRSGKSGATGLWLKIREDYLSCKVSSSVLAEWWRHPGIESPESSCLRFLEERWLEER